MILILEHFGKVMLKSGNWHVFLKKIDCQTCAVDRRAVLQWSYSVAIATTQAVLSLYPVFKISKIYPKFLGTTSMQYPHDFVCQKLSITGFFWYSYAKKLWGSVFWDMSTCSHTLKDIGSEPLAHNKMLYCLIRLWITFWMTLNKRSASYRFDKNSHENIVYLLHVLYWPTRIYVVISYILLTLTLIIILSLTALILTTKPTFFANS